MIGTKPGRTSWVFAAVLTATISTLGGPCATAGTPTEVPGAQLYQARCGSCHSLDANRVGPAHRGVVGRRAGTAPGYRYSPALAASGIIWTEQNLDRWLQGTQKMVPGAKMSLVVANLKERAAIIAYLKSEATR